MRDERSKLLRSIRPMTPDEVRQNAVPGQYGPARIGGEDVPGFRQEPGVDPQSQTDTYAAVTFFVDNWRWAGVPFYMRTGKRLAKRVTEIAIQFKRRRCTCSIRMTARSAPNLLILRIQPEEGISLKFLSKRPGCGHDAAAGVDGFQLRVELRGALALGLRDPAAGRDHRRRRRSTRGRTWWRRAGPWSSRFRTCGAQPSSISRTMRREVGGRRRRMRCWRAAGTHGGSRERHRRSRNDPQGTGRAVGSTAGQGRASGRACCAPAP